jgi:hypothetical protein
MYLSVIIRHTLIYILSRSKIFVLRSFRNLSLNKIWLDQNPTIRSSQKEMEEWIDSSLSGMSMKIQ